jgi:leader peptidase (prepilin peptidase)/N-methyltransferase
MIVYAVIALFGLVVGSFLNVCIVRLPRSGSIVSPPSHCPRCREPIRYADNIPVVSFLLLRGKCRSCGEPISWRYPLVEVMNALFYVWIVREFGLGGEAGLLMAFCSSLIVITFIDIDHQIIPDAITFPGILIGVIVGPFFLSSLYEPLPPSFGYLVPHNWPWFVGFLNSVIGMLCGGLPLWLLGWAWEKLRHVEAMGGGDVKLMGMVGSFLGWKGAFLTIFLGAITGSLAGIGLILLRRHDPDKVIPFGPFLALGSIVTAFYGPDIISWYVALVRT